MYVNTATLILTNNCNMACDYCFTGQKNPKRMSFAMAKRTVDWFCRDEVSGPENLFLIFFGGEPLLEFDLMQRIVTYAERKARAVGKSIGFSATTNGTLVDNRVVKFCREHGLGLLLSLDGVEAAHDLHRRFRNGRGTFRAVERNIDRVLGIGFGKGVRMTITPGNIGYMMTSVRGLVERGFDSLALFYDFYSTWTEEELRLAEEMFFELGDFYVGNIEQGHPLNVWCLDRCIRIGLSGHRNWAERGVCGAALSAVSVGHDGKIYPCAYFATCGGFRGAFPIGSVDDGFDERSRKPFARLKRKHLLGCDIPCDHCDIANRCLAGCPAMNYELTGNIALNPPTARFFNIIWDDVSRSIVEYFGRHPSPHFDSRYKARKKNCGKECHPECECGHASKGP